MLNHQLFCSACDRNVRVLISESPAGEHQGVFDAREHRDLLRIA